MGRSEERRRPGVGVAVVVERDGAVLLVRRKQHGGGSWSVPGGYLDQGEELAEAAQRELREETGIEVEELSFLAISNDRFQDGKHNVTVWFAGRGVVGEPVVAAPEELDNLGWFPWRALPAPLYDSTRAFLAGDTLPPGAVDSLGRQPIH